jgi:N-methylhydantoinase A
VAVVTHAASVSDLEREIGADVRLALENERLQAEDVPEEQMSIQRLIDMRYLGQWRSLTISVEAPVDLEAAVARFHAEHQREYNYSREGAPVEIYRLNVRAVGVTPKPNLKARGSNGSATPGPQGTRLVHFDELDEPVETPVYLRADLQVGTGLTGPAIIEQLDSTTVVPPGWRAEVDEWLNIRMQDEEPTA